MFQAGTGLTGLRSVRGTKCLIDRGFKLDHFSFISPARWSIRALPLMSCEMVVPDSARTDICWWEAEEHSIHRKLKWWPPVPATDDFNYSSIFHLGHTQSIFDHSLNRSQTPTEEAVLLVLLKKGLSGFMQSVGQHESVCYFSPSSSMKTVTADVCAPTSWMKAL